VSPFIRELNESSESRKPIRRIRRIRGQAISLFGFGYAGLGFLSSENSEGCGGIVKEHPFLIGDFIHE
jgi:hypothetical protein